jgi:hypothetical protein
MVLLGMVILVYIAWMVLRMPFSSVLPLFDCAGSDFEPTPAHSKSVMSVTAIRCRFAIVGS